jgi:hypothetical protein
MASEKLADLGQQDLAQNQQWSGLAPDRRQAAALERIAAALESMSNRYEKDAEEFNQLVRSGKGLSAL